MSFGAKAPSMRASTSLSHWPTTRHTHHAHGQAQNHIVSTTQGRPIPAALPPYLQASPGRLLLAHGLDGHLVARHQVHAQEDVSEASSAHLRPALEPPTQHLPCHHHGHYLAVLVLLLGLSVQRTLCFARPRSL